MAKNIPDDITRKDVLDAIDAFSDGAVQHNFHDSEKYDLLHDDKRYPPKAIRNHPMKAYTPLFLAAFIGLSPAAIAQEESEPISDFLIEAEFFREEKSDHYVNLDYPLRDRGSRLWLADKVRGFFEYLRLNTPALSPDEREYLLTEIIEIGQLEVRSRQQSRLETLRTKGLHHRQRVRSLCDDILLWVTRIEDDKINLNDELRYWTEIYYELMFSDDVSDAADFMVSKGYWGADLSSVFGSAKMAMQGLGYNVYREVIEPAARQIKAPDDSQPYLPEEGDVSVEMKGFDGTWSEVVLIHGYLNNNSPAEMIKEMAEKTSGRPPESFRLKEH